MSLRGTKALSELCMLGAHGFCYCMLLPAAVERRWALKLQALFVFCWCTPLFTAVQGGEQLGWRPHQQDWALPQLQRALQSETLKDMLSAEAEKLKPMSTAAEGAASWDGDGMDLSSDAPDEVLRHILSLLSPLCLARAGASCRKWRQLAAEDELWRPHLARLPRSVRGTAAAAAVAGMPGARQQLSRILTGALQRGRVQGVVPHVSLRLLCQRTGLCGVASDLRSSLPAEQPALAFAAWRGAGC